MNHKIKTVAICVLAILITTFAEKENDESHFGLGLDVIKPGLHIEYNLNQRFGIVYNLFVEINGTNVKREDKWIPSFTMKNRGINLVGRYNFLKFTENLKLNLDVGLRGGYFAGIGINYLQNIANGYHMFIMASPFWVNAEFDMEKVQYVSPASGQVYFGFLKRI